MFQLTTAPIEPTGTIPRQVSARRQQFSAHSCISGSPAAMRRQFSAQVSHAAAQAAHNLARSDGMRVIKSAAIKQACAQSSIVRIRGIDASGPRRSKAAIAARRQARRHSKQFRMWRRSSAEARRPLGVKNIETNGSSAGG
ncbi:hypothetical protein HB662_27285 [Roseomonas frigidaquae]|uniref:Uncharacterized protein n=1 Tax=Falsiroseomonas frigidaquae TaxID=487318 RepID=A0ABX1F803_9PROT|nr:hypothetical protein [Falsiroseomonas frigidaquae]NKE48504.1 hypothetical protein [Falsiroseomonas frigidaquae]